MSQSVDSGQRMNAYGELLRDREGEKGDEDEREREQLIQLAATEENVRDGRRKRCGSKGRNENVINFKLEKC